MIGRRLFSIVVVICCLLALVSLSASLESAVETPPDEAIELEYSSLPLSVEEASELKRSYQSGSSADGGSASTSPLGGPELPAPGATLAAFLSAVGSSLLWPLVAGVAVLFSLSRRDRILAWMKRRLREPPSGGDATAGADGDRPFQPPRNVVERSWLELLSKADVDPDPSATPRETAAELVGVGFDRRAVWELTELFEEVRYDDAPATPARVHRAVRCLREVTEE